MSTASRAVVARGLVVDRGGSRVLHGLDARHGRRQRSDQPALLTDVALIVAASVLALALGAATLRRRTP